MIAVDIPAAWERSAETIRRHGWRRVLVLGGIDRGKSTYCAFLASRLGGRVALIDADVGQKDIGPPATITLGYMPMPSGDSAMRPAASYFVGSTSPMGQLLPMIVGVGRMRDAAEATTVIVNTTGFIHGAGRSLKAHKIETLRPDVIVALAAGDELDAILAAHRNQRILRLRPSPRAAAKTAQQRKDNRETAFRRYFAGAAELVLPLTKLVIQRSLLFTGETLADPHFIHAERTAEGIIAVGASGHRLRGLIKVLPAGFEVNLLCGVADRHDDGLGLAIIRRIDFRRATIALITPVPRHAIAVLQLGGMYVSPDGSELGRAHL